MGLYATLAVTGNQLASDKTDGTEAPATFYFRGAKELYKDAGWKAATGITDVTATHEIIDSDSKKILAIKRVRYAGSKSPTIENKTADGGIVGLTWKGVSKADRLKGKPVNAVIETRKMIVD